MSASAPPRSRGPERSPLHATLRALGAGLVSLLVVLGCVWYVVAPTGVATRVRVQEAPLPAGSDASVLEARLEIRDDLRPSDASLILRPLDGPARVVPLAGTATAAPLDLAPGAYDLESAVTVDGAVRTATARVDVREGVAYRVTLQASRTGLVTMLPVSSY
ncbi:hypothetical protein K8Z61_14465 [Nocardioides sp. TRM66260-LWL]|uniref:hypothetical protein n=1 Tax=Nocardioides sp. TRM66260-LWL TaxID=2874478 RepID=UPI001CC3C211|nr:hypothetical protein [Nocardioides sp. TRM66260-LWL]MBZ5735695.1 hypothetical protein [Nocardioides sp. TRM66260-LWL]